MSRMINYAMNFLGTPYRWGGNSPTLGYDCSGFVQELLASEGIDPPGDQTAQALADFIQTKGITVQLPIMGSLLFFGKSKTQITHVAVAISPFQMIEAGGGDSTTVTNEIADKQGAMVRIRPISRRNDLVLIIMPRPIF